MHSVSHHQCSVSHGTLWYVFVFWNDSTIANTQQDPSWHDPQVEAEMNELLRLRDLVNGLLEKPRRKKYVAKKRGWRALV